MNIFIIILALAGCAIFVYSMLNVSGSNDDETEEEFMRRMKEYEDNKKSQKLGNCKVCNSQNISHEEKKGRGLPPKDYIKKQGDKRKISWLGIWDVWICNDCGDKIQKLRRE